MWGKWLAQAIVDSDCRVALAPSLVWTFFRSNGSARYHQIHKEVFAKTTAMCNYLRHASAAEVAGAAIEWLPLRREYFNCLHDYTAPGDQIGQGFTCMYRFYSRYPTEGQRRNVTVLFPDAPEYPGLMNTIGMFQRHLGEVTILLLAKDKFFGLRNGDMIAPSRVPGQFPGTHDEFFRQVLWPRVNATFAGKLTPHRRIALISTGSSVTNRAYRLTSTFLALMAKYGFVVLPPELPHDERMYHINTADVFLSSLGSTLAVSNQLGGCCNRIPRLILVHSGYNDEVPLWCPTQNVTCKRGVVWYHKTQSVKNKLALVRDSLIEDFLNLVYPGAQVLTPPAQRVNRLRHAL